MKKKKFILTVASLLIGYAAVAPSNGSQFVVGEPKLPKKLNN